jgi:hypothetical protein
MTDDISQKVINIFSKHKNDKSFDEDEKVIKCEDGVFCICVKNDKHGNAFDEEDLIEMANECQYIIKIMVNYSKTPYIYNYKVPGDKLMKFLSDYITHKKEGKIIEIEKYIPTDLA